MRRSMSSVIHFGFRDALVTLILIYDSALWVGSSNAKGPFEIPTVVTAPTEVTSTHHITVDDNRV